MSLVPLSSDVGEISRDEQPTFEAKRQGGLSLLRENLETFGGEPKARG